MIWVSKFLRCAFISIKDVYSQGKQSDCLFDMQMSFSAVQRLLGRGSMAFISLEHGIEGLVFRTVTNTFLGTKEIRNEKLVWGTLGTKQVYFRGTREQYPIWNASNGEKIEH